MLTAPDPYRSTPRRAGPALADGGCLYVAERIAAEAFVLAWACLRLALCGSDGVGADGILAGVLAVTVAVELASFARAARRERIPWCRSQAITGQPSGERH
jgi:hypothetical protein